jgi:hypothetical protein
MERGRARDGTALRAPLLARSTANLTRRLSVRLREAGGDVFQARVSLAFADCRTIASAHKVAPKEKEITAATANPVT